MESIRKNTALLKRFWPYLWKQKRTLLTDLFCASLTTAAEIVLPLIVRRITNAATGDLALLTPRFILMVGGGYLALRIMDAAANFYMNSRGHFMGTKIETDLRNDLFAHLQDLSFSYFDNSKIGVLMSRLTNDLNDITEFAHHFPEELFITVIKVSACMVIFLRLNVFMALIVFSILPVMFLCTWPARRRQKEQFRAHRAAIGEINAAAENTLLGVRVVKSFNGEEEENEKFRRHNEVFYRVKEKSFTYMGQYHTITRMFDGVMYLAAVCFGAWLLQKGTITAGDFALVLLMVSTLLGSVRRIIEFSEQFQKGTTGIERFAEIMDEVTETAARDGSIELTDVKGEIVLENVSFTYPGTQQPVLQNISLHIKPGQNIALCGPSGGGKTTLCNLIPRFYEPTAGTIAIDGIDIKEITLESLRRNIGVVQQDVYLFSGTIRENIAYGYCEAHDSVDSPADAYAAAFGFTSTQPTDAQIREAARLAGIDAFAESLPDGYDTYVGERGVKLSGGQKQRVSIARVFLKNPPILILDEATSALDNESERLVQKSLELLSENRTTITIAHRLTTIKNADQILVLTEDGFAEHGSHTELLDKGGLYAAMWGS
ncbi:MAG: ABC transporter ATP-binding protein/permease [Oscillospiraceae bacterium]|jgi:ATP-binding cassette subfamily B protein|nr:ABC transporter ATP-binding protein/permease [Oscillospiraceae bacterium]